MSIPPTLSHIKRLPRNVAEKIAAGEVVERPASCVKELVENSLDAGARNIEVTLETGGLRSIIIKDDGCGIRAEELPLALERHATSKIENADDLWRLSTMGFRGEALASISAISRFTLESRFAGEKGRRILLEGGETIKDEPLEFHLAQTSLNMDSPGVTGTTITVEHLFYNVPARLKFAKSKSSEALAARDALERIAFSWPEVSFHLNVEGRETLNLPAVSTPQERIAQILGTSPEKFKEFQSQYHSITVRGWLDIETRGKNSKQIYLSVNRRMVKDKLLLQAVQVALRPLMMEGEYPRLYLELMLPPERVDVNVHPTKTEIRFERSQDIFQLIQIALTPLARAKGPQPYTVSPSLGETPSSRDSVSVYGATDSEFGSAKSTLPTSTLDLPASFDHSWPSHSPLHNGAATLESTSASKNIYKQESLQMASASLFKVKESSLTETDPKASQGFSNQVFPSENNTPATAATQKAASHYIGQLKNTYLLFQDEKGLVIIDQHAAHERIRYEKIKTDFFNHGLKSQPLLLSLTIKVRPETLGLLLETPEFFTKFGFEVEAFGDKDLLVRAIPEELNATQAREVITALIAMLEDSEKSLPQDLTLFSPKLERLLSTAACHSSVRAGQALSAHEAQALVNEMQATPSANHCPHGRPASLRLEYGEIEALFKRKV